MPSSNESSDESILVDPGLAIKIGNLATSQTHPGDMPETGSTWSNRCYPSWSGECLSCLTICNVRKPQTSPQKSVGAHHPSRPAVCSLSFCGLWIWALQGKGRFWTGWPCAGAMNTKTRSLSKTRLLSCSAIYQKLANLDQIQKPGCIVCPRTYLFGQ